MNNNSRSFRFFTAAIAFFAVVALGSVSLTGQTATPDARAVPVSGTPAAAPRVASTSGISPHETISAKIDGNRVILVYGRPYSKDPKTGAIRKIWGGLVPYEKIWRTGSDEATMLVTQKDIVMGGLTIPAGAYTVFTFPASDGSAKLIINKEIGQWGIDPYHADHELGRIDLKKDTLDKSVDEFTMVLEPTTGADGKLSTTEGRWKMMWETTQYSVTYTVKK